MSTQTLRYGDERIRYRIRFAPANKGKLAIHVMPGGEVWVDAPEGESLARIKRAMGARARWISEHLRVIGERRLTVLPREYVSGESHFYLGRRYVLKVRQARDEPPSASLTRGRLEVVVASRDPAEVQTLLRAWYRTRARAVFDLGLQHWVEALDWLREAPRWKLIEMKRQWGSCSPGGTLSLNPHLVKAPRSCIEYVLLHELCHLRYLDHSRAFQRLLTRHVPDWKQVKQRLDGMAEQLLMK